MNLELIFLATSICSLVKKTNYMFLQLFNFNVLYIKNYKS